MYIKHFRQGNERLGLADNCDELDWILLNSDYQILFYDSKQSICPSDISPSTLVDRLFDNHRGIRPIDLKEQMRIKAGGEYVNYIYNILYQRTKERKRFENYEFKLFSSFSDLVNLLWKREDEVGLCRLCGGYAWKWKGRDDPESTDIIIDGVSIKWNRQTKGWLRNEQAKQEMGSIYTLPGVDLNYTGVVIGYELYFDKATQQIKVDKSRFVDDKVKKGTSDEELEKYILNTYGVFFTRGIQGTYVYVCDEALREYLSNFIPVV